ncbi:MAG: DUF721 domain-containing protein [Bacteroidales bacterium]|nr:DUF721 domain-containing protein [Bacteroidales bacterium]
MRKSNTQTINEMVDSFFKHWGLDRKRKEMRIINQWDEIVGLTISRVTTNIYINKEILFLQINSSLVRNELLMIKSGLIDKINRMSGEEIIKDIVIR